MIEKNKITEGEGMAFLSGAILTSAIGIYVLSRFVGGFALSTNWTAISVMAFLGAICMAVPAIIGKAPLKAYAVGAGTAIATVCVGMILVAVGFGIYSLLA